MAKTYSQLHPSSSILLLDEGSDIGGVWGSTRLYPTLKTNNVFGHFQFSDFPMIDSTTAYGQHIPGPVVNRYLKDFADAFDLTRRVQVDTVVRAAEMQSDNSWILRISTRGTAAQSISATRLVVATGQTSRPILPKIDGSDSFGEAFFHSKDLAARMPMLGNASSAVVLGGTKSAWDAAYSLAEAGIQVHWVIRKSGMPSHIPAHLPPKQC